jgi:hypothetical protein
MKLTPQQALERIQGSGMARTKGRQDSASPSIDEDEGVIEIEPLGLEVYEE